MIRLRDASWACNCAAGTSAAAAALAACSRMRPRALALGRRGADWLVPRTSPGSRPSPGSSAPPAWGIASLAEANSEAAGLGSAVIRLCAEYTLPTLNPALASWAATCAKASALLW